MNCASYLAALPGVFIHSSNSSHDLLNTSSLPGCAIKSSNLYSRAKKLSLIKKQRIPQTITFELKSKNKISKKEISEKLFDLVSSLKELGLNAEEILREHNNSVIKKITSNKD